MEPDSVWPKASEQHVGWVVADRAEQVDCPRSVSFERRLEEPDHLRHFTIGELRNSHKFFTLSRCLLPVIPRTLESLRG